MVLSQRKNFTFHIMQKLKSYLIIFLNALILACSSDTEKLKPNKPQDSKFDHTKDSFTKKYLFDSHQNLLKLDVDKLSHFQTDSLLRFLYVLDQKFRIEINENKKLDSIDRTTRGKLFGKMEKADEINFTLLKRIHEKLGWPSNKVFTDSAVDGSFMITLHYKGHDLNYLIPLIEESFSKNEIKNVQYAILIDRVLIRNGKSQKFGTHCKMTRNGTVDFTSLPDTSGINQNRIEIGLKELNWNTCDLVSY
jgi:hypothetical protein